jgi:hypothetical protein
MVYSNRLSACETNRPTSRHAPISLTRSFQPKLPSQAECRTFKQARTRGARVPRRSGAELCRALIWPAEHSEANRHCTPTLHGVRSPPGINFELMNAIFTAVHMCTLRGYSRLTPHCATPRRQRQVQLEDLLCHTSAAPTSVDLTLLQAVLAHVHNCTSRNRPRLSTDFSANFILEVRSREKREFEGSTGMISYSMHTADDVDVRSGRKAHAV